MFQGSAEASEPEVGETMLEVANVDYSFEILRSEASPLIEVMLAALMALLGRKIECARLSFGANEFTPCKVTLDAESELQRTKCLLIVDRREYPVLTVVRNKGSPLRAFVHAVLNPDVDYLDFSDQALEAAQEVKDDGTIRPNDSSRP